MEHIKRRVAISYYLVQRQTDFRKQKEILLDLIEKLCLQVSDKRTYDFSTVSKEEISMWNRDISNKIELLKKFQSTFSYEKELTFISEKFEEYEHFVGDHFDDREYLCKSRNELQRPMRLIDSKLVELAMNLFQ